MAKREAAKPFHEFKVRMPNALYAHLRQHAHDRKVYVSQLVDDVMQVWTYLVTDPADPTFAPERTGQELPALPKERYLNYLQCLGFNLDELINEGMDLAGLFNRPLPITPGERTWEAET